jgi:hypothetical protein
MHQFGFVGGGHHDHVGNAGEIGDVERTRVGRAIRADEAGGGLTSRDTIIAAEALAKHIDREEKRIKAEWAAKTKEVT